MTQKRGHFSTKMKKDPETASWGRKRRESEYQGKELKSDRKWRSYETRKIFSIIWTPSEKSQKMGPRGGGGF